MSTNAYYLMQPTTHAGLAALLCKKCEGASAWAQETSQEVDRLSAEVLRSVTVSPTHSGHIIQDKLCTGAA